MRIIQKLWHDESGLILSAEAVTIGTVGVLGTIVGLNAAGTAIDGEMKEMASAIRSLDQSYGYVGHRGCGAWTAGSYYRQPDVQHSLAELSADGDINSIQQQVDAERKLRLSPAPHPVPHVEPTAAPLPNEIPDTSKKAPEPSNEHKSEVVPPKADAPQN